MKLAADCAPGDDVCPVCATAELVCAKWTILVIRDLAEGRSRFCELERSLAGISPRYGQRQMAEQDLDGTLRTWDARP
jgi:DNA-binding HxlR family transcriptional regulator